MLTFGSFLIKALWKMKVWALKKISKKSIWAGFVVDDSNRHKDKATSLRFSCTRLLLLWKAAYLPENKKST
ncbi:MULTISPECIES: hypothetical protein [unclassified Bartonella]|uniref:hypothetical protein n=1 Tax=unclassified Bartonella TaxID=2645622 RepID=UPI0035CFB9C1